jgi:hypothetical protein
MCVAGEESKHIFTNHQTPAPLLAPVIQPKAAAGRLFEHVPPKPIL